MTRTQLITNLASHFRNLTAEDAEVSVTLILEPSRMLWLTMAGSKSGGVAHFHSTTRSQEWAGTLKLVRS